MWSRLAAWASAGLVLAHVIQLAYVSPGSLGQHEDHLDDVIVTLTVLTMLNFAVALTVTMIGVRRQDPHRATLRGFRIGHVSEMQFDLLLRLSNLMSTTAKRTLVAVTAAGIVAACSGFATLSTTPATYDENGHFYRRAHSGLVPISHAAFATAQHPGVVATAGVITFLQVLALCLTKLAIHDRNTRALHHGPS